MTTTTTTATAARTIVALDLGKYKSVACLYTGDPATATFVSFTTDRDWLRKLFAKHCPAAVVIEACLLAGWVHDLCHELALPCHVANTASEAWKFKHQKRKTDRDDALRLAQLFALGQLPTVTVPPPASKQASMTTASGRCLATSLWRRSQSVTKVRKVAVAGSPV